MLGLGYARRRRCCVTCQAYFACCSHPTPDSVTHYFTYSNLPGLIHTPSLISTRVFLLVYSRPALIRSSFVCPISAADCLLPSLRPQSVSTLFQRILPSNTNMAACIRAPPEVSRRQLINTQTARPCLVSPSARHWQNNFSKFVIISR